MGGVFLRSGRRIGVLLDVKAKGNMAQSLCQLPPQQDFFQLWGRSVLLEAGEDRFWVSLAGRVDRLLSVRQRDRSSRFWRVDDIVGI